MSRDTPAVGVFEALESRFSVRGYLDQPVPRALVEQVLVAAARAPSGSNTQPWQVHVLTGTAIDRLGNAILAVRQGEETEPNPEYDYYPKIWSEPYRGRRRANGWELYGLLGIEKGDRVKSLAWHDRNFRFFGAPVGMILTRDRRMGVGALIDLGMFMQGVAVAARGLGLDTCAQAAFANYHAIIRSELNLPDEDMVICGMALGYADMSVPANRLRTEREPVSSFATFHTDDVTSNSEAH